jgi:hypothetical protein
VSNLDTIKKQTAGHALVRGIDTVRSGAVRLETAFLYPDGSSVDVFVREESPLFGTSRLSDLGQTTAWLLDVQVKPWLSKKRQRFLEDALRIYGVEQAGGALELALSSPSALMDGIVRLGQACVRVADLTYTRRSALQSGVSDELEEFLSDANLAFEANQELVGRQGAPVRVDFLVRGKTVQSALLALASANASQAHITANEIFRKWYDLDVPQRHEQRVTVFDDRFDAYRDEDLSRLRDLSDVVALSDRQSLEDLLAA